MARPEPAPAATPAAASGATGRPTAARWGAALAVALPGTALACGLMFGSTLLAGAQDLAAWRDGMAPRDYLMQHGGWHAREAQARLEAGLHAQGLVASLVASDWGITHHVDHLPPSVQAADLSADGLQAVTSDTTRAFVWRLPPPTATPAAATLTATSTAPTSEATARPAAAPATAASVALRQVWGAHSAAAAPDIRATGWGYGQVAWLDARAGQLVALATRGHPALWFHGDAAGAAPAASPAPAPLPAAPRPLSPSASFAGLDGMALHKGALLLWGIGQDQVHWLPRADAPAQALAHADVALAAWAPDGSVVTASRDEVRRWRGSSPLAQHRWQAPGQPVALSDDGAWAVVQADERLLTVLSTAADGPPPADLKHEAPVRPAAACGPWVVTGTSDGVLHVWQHTPSAGSAAPLRLVRQWPAYVGPIGLLLCRGERLLSTGRSGLGENHAMVWDLAGRPQPAVPPPPGHDQPRVGWTDQAALALGLGEPAARPLLDSWRANDHWLPPAGVVVWLLTLVGAGWLLRRR